MGYENISNFKISDTLISMCRMLYKFAGKYFPDFRRAAVNIFRYFIWFTLQHMSTAL